VAAGIYQQWLVTPAEVAHQLEEEHRLHNQQILDLATDEHPCPGGQRIVVTSGDPDRSGEASAISLELFLLPAEGAGAALRLAAGRPDHGLIRYPALQEFRGLVEGCLGDSDAMERFFDRLETRALQTSP